MNPNTGEFHPIQNDADLRSVTEEESKNWPRFSLEEVLIVKGVKMRVANVTRHVLVLQPVQQEILHESVPTNPKKKKSYNRRK